MIEFDLDRHFRVVSCSYESASRDAHPVLPDRRQCWGTDVHMCDTEDLVDYTKLQ
jgi:hypothetical protein